MRTVFGAFGTRLIDTLKGVGTFMWHQSLAKSFLLPKGPGTRTRLAVLSSEFHEPVVICYSCPPCIFNDIVSAYENEKN